MGISNPLTDPSISTSSKTLPFLALAIAFLLAVVEGVTGYDFPLEQLAPMLTLMGIGGIPLSMVKNAVSAKKQINKEEMRNVLKELGIATDKTALA
jgi:hypothetical protein